MTPIDERESTRQAEQYSALEYILIGDLRDLLEEPQDDVTRRWMLAVLEALLKNLPCQFALQETDGFMEEVLEQFPTWYRHVDQLKEQQQRLFQNLQALHDKLLREEPPAEIAPELRQDLKDWLSLLAAYHRHQIRLLQSAYNMELGGGD